MWRLPLVAALFLGAAVSAQSQSPTVTVTPTLVSVQLGQPLYCAAKWTKSLVQVQLYCYTSSAGHTWDLLIYNSVFPVNTTITLPYVMTCPPGLPGCSVSDGILWIFRQVSGVVTWEVAWNGTGDQKGTFQ